MLEKYKKLDPEKLERRIWYLENAITRLSDRISLLEKPFKPKKTYPTHD